MRAAQSTLPILEMAPNKPWISRQTMELIDARKESRASGEWDEERRLHKLIRAAAKKDKTDWLNDRLLTGGWKEIRRLRKPARRQPGKLRNIDGAHVDSDRWAETMAEHLEKVQWKVRLAGLTDTTPLGDTLPVCSDEITEEEVAEVLKKNFDSIGQRVQTRFRRSIGRPLQMMHEA